MALQAEGAAFLFFPNRYVHPSWREEMMQPPLWDLLGATPRTEGRLAAFVADRAGLTLPATLAFDSPPACFCLLPWEAIEKIAHRTGLVLNAARFGKVIDGKLVARIRRDLGNEAYEFALRRAPLIRVPGRVPRSVQIGHPSNFSGVLGRISLSACEQ